MVIDMKKIILLALTLFFMNSIFAESPTQLEAFINESTEKLRTLEEKDKVEAEM